MRFQVQYGSSKLPQKFYTGEVDAFWRSETSFEESRRHYLEERDKLRKANAENAAGVKASTEPTKLIAHMRTHGEGGAHYIA
jgi:hypothetical protein